MLVLNMKRNFFSSSIFIILVHVISDILHNTSVARRGGRLECGMTIFASISKPFEANSFEFLLNSQNFDSQNQSLCSEQCGRVYSTILHKMSAETLMDSLTSALANNQARQFIDLHSHKLLHFLRRQKDSPVRRLSEVRIAVQQVLQLEDLSAREVESVLVLLNNLSCYESVSKMVLGVGTLVRFRKFIFESLLSKEKSQSRSLYAIFYFISNLLYENSNSDTLYKYFFSDDLIKAILEFEMGPSDDEILKHLSIILAFLAKKSSFKHRQLVVKSVFFHLRMSQYIKTVLNLILTLRFLLVRRAIHHRDLTKNQLLEFLVGQLERVDRKDHISVILDSIGLVVKVSNISRIKAHKLDLCGKIQNYFDEFPTCVTSIINNVSTVGCLPVTLYHFFIGKFRISRSVFALKCAGYLIRALSPEDLLEELQELILDELDNIAEGDSSMTKTVLTVLATIMQRCRKDLPSIYTCAVAKFFSLGMMEKAKSWGLEEIKLLDYVKRNHSLIL